MATSGQVTGAGQGTAAPTADPGAAGPAAHTDAADPAVAADPTVAADHAGRPADPEPGDSGAPSADPAATSPDSAADDSATDPDLATDPALATGPAPDSRRDRRRAWIVIALGFLAARVVLWTSGTRFSTALLRYPSLWHLLDEEYLRHHPFGALWDQHTQPPLFNVLIGVVLRWSPAPEGISFQVVWAAFALVAALALYEVLRGFGCRWWVAVATTVFVFSDPGLIEYEHTLTYECAELALILGTVWACQRYAHQPTLKRLAVFAGVGTTLVLTRALFHPLWLAVALGLVLAIRPPRADWRRTALVLCVPLILVVGLMAKNQVRFDTFALSSWFGMNLERAAVNSLPPEDVQQLIDDGTLSPQAVLPAFSSYDHYVPYAEPCDPHYGSTVLDDADKSEGTMNPNYACYLPLYDQAQKDAIAAIRARPGEYLTTLRGNTLTFFHDPMVIRVRLYTLGNVLTRTHAIVGLEVPATAHFNYFDVDLRIRLTAVIAVLGLLGAGIVAAVRALRGQRTPAVATTLFVGFTILFASLSAILFDIFETARFRVPLDPILYGAVLAFLLEAVARGIARARLTRAGRSTGPSPEPSG